MREALHERELSLTTLAPHLVKPLPFLFPLTKRVWKRRTSRRDLPHDQLGGAIRSATASDEVGCGWRRASSAVR